MSAADISNLRAGRGRRQALVLATAGLLALSLAGVAVRPALGLRAAEEERSAAELRMARRQQEARALEQYEGASGPARSRETLASLARALPAPLPDLELHGLVRLLAERQGLRLRALSLGAPYDPGLARLEDVAALRELRLEGEGDLLQLVRLLAALRGLGRPLAVLELRFDQAAASPHWTLVLGFFESHPAADFPLEEPSLAEEQA